MNDPRERLGVTVEQDVTGPYEVMASHPASPDTGGTLDRGIVAHTRDGRRVVIGEVWAACVGKDWAKVRIDADAVARRIIATLNLDLPGMAKLLADLPWSEDGYALLGLDLRDAIVTAMRAASREGA